MTEDKIQELLKVVDVASRQSDRWLFLAALIVLMVFTYFVIRWLVSELGRSRESYQIELDKHRIEMTRMLNEQSALSVNLKVSLDRNTDALRVNNALLERRA